MVDLYRGTQVCAAATVCATTAIFGYLQSKL